MTERLTQAERQCCHMSQWFIGSLRQWREEFANLPHDERCGDCPVRISPDDQTRPNKRTA